MSLSLQFWDMRFKFFAYECGDKEGELFYKRKKIETDEKVWDENVSLSLLVRKNWDYVGRWEKKKQKWRLKSYYKIKWKFEKRRSNESNEEMAGEIKQRRC